MWKKKKIWKLLLWTLCYEVFLHEGNTKKQLTTLEENTGENESGRIPGTLIPHYELGVFLSFVYFFPIRKNLVGVIVLWDVPFGVALRAQSPRHCKTANEIFLEERTWHRVQLKTNNAKKCAQRRRKKWRTKEASKDQGAEEKKKREVGGMRSAHCKSLPRASGAPPCDPSSQTHYFPAEMEAKRKRKQDAPSSIFAVTLSKMTQRM